MGRRRSGRGELRQELLASQARRQFLRIEIGRDDDERVVMRRARWRARPGKIPDSLRALAPHIFVGWLANLALGEAGYRRGNAIRDPVMHTRTAAAFWILHQNSKA